MIGILTFHHVYNYGAVLQAYGLQQFLKSNGYEVSIINIKTFHRKKPGAFGVKSAMSCVMKKGYYQSYLDSRNKAIKFDRFCSDYLLLSKKFDDLNQFENQNTAINTFVVGSDQIWNPKFGTKAMNTYFLSEVSNKRKKISYAGCIGSSVVDFKTLNQYSNLIQEFDHISVRDEFTKEYLDKIVKKNVDLVVDPSLLIDWSEKYVDLTHFNLPPEYIFVYGISNNTEKILYSLKNEFNLPIVTVGMENEDKSYASDFVLNDVGPLEWVELIKHSSYVVTKSFHGLMFALNFSKQVLIISTGFPAISRLEDICKRLNIGHIIVENEKDLRRFHNLENIINYDVVAENIQEKIMNSKKLLLKYIN